MKKLTAIFKVLANERRLRILKILLVRKELSVSEMANKIGLSYKSTSKHLIILEKAGFLQYRMEQMHTFYSINNKLEKSKLQLLEMIRKNK